MKGRKRKYDRTAVKTTTSKELSHKSLRKTKAKNGWNPRTVRSQIQVCPVAIPQERVQCAFAQSCGSWGVFLTRLCFRLYTVLTPNATGVSVVGYYSYVNANGGGGVGWGSFIIVVHATIDWDERRRIKVFCHTV